jgi:hypothetical protein
MATAAAHVAIASASARHPKPVIRAGLWSLLVTFGASLSTKRDWDWRLLRLMRMSWPRPSRAVHRAHPFYDPARLIAMPVASSCLQLSEAVGQARLRTEAGLSAHGLGVRGGMSRRRGLASEPVCWAAQSLAEAAPAEALAALREPLEAALAAGPQDEDRPRACAAAEVLSGLLASGVLFRDTGAPRRRSGGPSSAAQLWPRTCQGQGALC